MPQSFLSILGALIPGQGNIEKKIKCLADVLLHAYFLQRKF